MYSKERDSDSVMKVHYNAPNVMKMITILLSRVLFTMCHNITCYMLTDNPKDEVFTTLLMLGLCIIIVRTSHCYAAATDIFNNMSKMF